MARLTYNPSIFDVADLESARRIILTPEPDTDTDERWRRETPYLAAQLSAHLMPQRDHTILDFGCGIGRLSKALIEQHGCRVIGVDISASMRAMAADYVASERFAALSPEDFAAQVASGLRVDGAFACWVIQHVLDPVAALEQIRAALAPAARLFVANAHLRCVPVVEGAWGRDGIVVRTVLEQMFRVRGFGALDPRWVGENTAATSFWGLYTLKGEAG